jgi:hypothetical protein
MLNGNRNAEPEFKIEILPERHLAFIGGSDWSMQSSVLVPDW